MSPQAVVRAAAAHRPLRYLAIDGTHEQDSVAFGRELEKAGWKNLLAGALRELPPVGREPPRLEDPAHPYLPVYRSDGETAGPPVEVVCPSGLDGVGQDSVWSGYRGTYRTRTGRQVTDILAAAEQSAAFAGELFLRPAIQYSPTLRRYHLADPSVAGSRPPEAADLLYVSSHGWLGGFFRGNDVEVPIGGASIHAVSAYFTVGRAAGQGLGLSGPRWLVLAQCSTLNSATWTLWAKILAKSTPHVRGILAYEESAPGHVPSSALARKFVDGLRAGGSFLQTWIAVNDSYRRKWAAIVHEKARSDRLRDFSSFKPFTSVQTTSTSGPYLGFLSSTRQGTRILDVPPPFDLQVEVNPHGSWEVVRPENLDTTSRIRRRLGCRLTVKAPAAEALKSVELEAIHIRPTYPKQYKWDDIFAGTLLTPGLISRYPGKKLRVELPRPPADVQLQCLAGPLDLPGMEAHHSYFWFRAVVELQSGRTLRYDFKTNGLLMLG
jgi:hypothetical protein